MNVSEQFFALIPGAPLYDFIMECKKMALELTGSQKYLTDPPHITFYLGVFKMTEDSYQILRDRLGSLSAGKMFYTAGWKLFDNDPVTGGTTLAVGLKPESENLLKMMQGEVVKTTAPLRTMPAPPRYQNLHFSAKMQESLNQYGFPFVGDIWIPHITIASFDSSGFENVRDLFLGKTVPSSFPADLFKHYLIDSEDGFGKEGDHQQDHFTEMRSFRL